MTLMAQIAFKWIILFAFLSWKKVRVYLHDLLLWKLSSAYIHEENENIITVNDTNGLIYE